MAQPASKRRKVSHQAGLSGPNGDFPPPTKTAEDKREQSTALDQGSKFATSLGRPPNFQESQRYQQYVSTTTHNSGILKLQMDGLVSSVRPEYQTWTNKVEQTLRKLKSVIEAIPSREYLPVRCFCAIAAGEQVPLTFCSFKRSQKPSVCSTNPKKFESHFPTQPRASKPNIQSHLRNLPMSQSLEVTLEKQSCLLRASWWLTCASRCLR